MLNSLIKKINTTALLLIVAATLTACSDNKTDINAKAQSGKKVTPVKPTAEANLAPQMSAIKQKHDKHCNKCHTDTVYTRDERFVHSKEALKEQVERCKESSNAPWFEEDTQEIVQFLNTQYYRF